MALGAFLAARGDTQLATAMSPAQASTLAASVAVQRFATRSAAVTLAQTPRLCSVNAANDNAALATAMPHAPSVALLFRFASWNDTLVAGFRAPLHVLD